MTATDDHQLLLDLVRAAVAERLGRPAWVAADRLARRGDWAFLWARLVDQEGRPLSFAGTHLAAAEAAGAVSKGCAALLERQGDGWAIRELAVGPTDVAWADWGARHDVPAALFDQ